MKLNERGGSRTDTIVKLILVFFISLLSFSVGTFVGKQFSDSQHRLAALENEYNKDSSEGREVASIPAEGETADNEKPKEILSNEDVAKLAEEFVQDKNSDRKVANEGETKETAKPEAKGEVKADAKPEVKADPKAEAKKDSMPIIGSLKKEKQAIEKMIKEKTSPAPTKVAINEKSPADKIAEGKAPLEAVKPKVELKKVEKGLPLDVTGDVKGKYTIQVSSHQTEMEAKTRVEQLAGKGYVASYIPAQIDGKTWYRVGIGAFSNVKSAKEYLAKVKTEDSSFKSAIIRQIVQ